MMQTIADYVRARIQFWGARLNALQAVLVAAIVANASQLQGAISSIIPAKYQGAAGLIAGVLSYLIVEAASRSDAKKVADNG
jgi:membrane associated rhomboid family serine protease